MTIAQVSLDRPLHSDVPAITAAMSDWQVAQWLTAPPWPYRDHHARDFVMTALPQEYAIRVDGQFAGVVRADESLGIWISLEYQGHGIGARACTLALSRKFQDGTGVCKANYKPGNHRSAALLTGLGFQPVEQGQISHDTGAAASDMVKMVLHRRDFARLHGIRLTTSRLVLDAYRPADLADLYRIATLPQVAAMLLRFYPGMPLPEARDILATDALTPPIRLVVRFQGKVVGSIGISDGQPPAIFYFLDPAVAGQGLAQEMTQAFLHEIRARFDPPELVADVFADNVASQKVLEKIGFYATETRMFSSSGRPDPAPGVIFRWQRGAR